jgi:hypothetical protein
MHSHRFLLFFTLVAALLTTSAFAFGREGKSDNKDNAAPVPVTVTVTVLGTRNKPASPIGQQDIIVHSGNKVLKVTGWEPAQGPQGQLQLALLIDENIRTGLIGEQLKDMAAFIEDKAPSTEVGVYYAAYGSAYAAAPFTTDHDKAAQALHLTPGLHAGESPSIYLSLSDLAKHWPMKLGARREVVVFGSGNDPLNPGIQDPYADASIEDVLKAGLTVHAIPIAGTRYSLSFRGNISAGKLIELSEQTGGETIGGDLGAPVSLAPYLNQLDENLHNQYLLTFLIQPSDKKKGELRDIEVKAEEHEFKVVAPKKVLVPGR